jgi:hypothetical protein
VRGGSYSAATLAAQAREIRGWLAAGLDAVAYFNDDWRAYAAADAATLRRLAARGPPGGRKAIRARRRAT